MKQLRIILTLFGVLCIFVLSACGGGGSSGGGSNPNNSSNNDMGNNYVKLDSSNGGVADGATNVSLTPLIILKFSSPVIPTTVNNNTISITTSPTNVATLTKKTSAKASLADGSVAIGTIVANNDNTVFSFSPDAPLSILTKYYVIVNGVKTLGGASIPGIIFSFTTGDFTIPIAGIISPNNNATGISTTPSIQLQFSKDVINVNQSTVTLHAGSISGTTISLGSITAGSNNTFVFSPGTTLNEQTIYYIVLSAGITDTSGNALTPTDFHFTTGDFAIPTVNILSPSNNATGISTNPSIQLQFSEAVNNVTPTTITLRAGSTSGTTIAIGSITAGSNNTFTFSPATALNEQTTYYVVLGSGITDISGNPLNPTNFQFTTGASTAPTASIISPNNNATGISTNPIIQLQFSKAVINVNQTTVTLRAGSVSGSTVIISSITAGANNTFTFSPGVALSQQTIYYVVLGTGITDTSGNPLIPTNFHFTTGDFTAPTVDIISPSNNATGISTSPSIQLQFSKAVITVDSSTVKLYQDSDLKIEIAIGKITAGSNNTFTFSPNSVLNGQTTYYVVLSSGITDLSGNSLAPTQFNFTTVGGSSLVCWGDNTYGQIATIDELKLVNPTSVSVGDSFICAQDQSGIHCWGNISHGQTDVPALENPTSLSAGGLGSCVIDNSAVTCWGYNKLSIPSLDKPTVVSAGSDYACALDSAGVHCFGGDNNYGQTTVPDKLSNITTVSAGLDSTCVLGENGVQCWGDNSHGQTEVPTLEVPTKISTGGFGSCAIDKSGVICWGDNKLTPPPLKSPTVVSAGGDYACALDTDGIHCWGGANKFGQTTVPDKLVSPTSVSAGTVNTCAITSN